MFPSISVVIPTKNRRDILRDTIHSILKQNVPLEIIVFDDGSTDGTSDMLRAEFPTIRVEQYAESAGPTLRRNQGARIAKGEFLFTIDDDCTFPHADTFAQTVAAFDDERVGAVTIPFINIYKGEEVWTVAPDAKQTYACFDYFGGMVAFRREVFLKIDGYRTYYFMNVEEGDLAVRLLDAGYIVKLGTAPPIDHHESPIRSSKRYNELGPRNNILYAWYNVPMPYFFPHVMATGLRAARHIARIGHPDQAIRGVCQGWLAIMHELLRRAPVSRSCYRLSRALRTHAHLPWSKVEPSLNPIQSSEELERRGAAQAATKSNIFA